MSPKYVWGRFGAVGYDASEVHRASLFEVNVRAAQNCGFGFWNIQQWAKLSTISSESLNTETNFWLLFYHFLTIFDQFLIPLTISWPLLTISGSFHIHFKPIFRLNFFKKTYLLLQEWQCGWWAAWLIFGKRICHCHDASSVWFAVNNPPNTICGSL